MCCVVYVHVPTKHLLCFNLLIYRRSKFETLLNDYHAEVESFQEKEVPRNLDDIKKVLSHLQQLSINLEAAKDEMMVSNKDLYINVHSRVSLHTTTYMFLMITPSPPPPSII